MSDEPQVALNDEPMCDHICLLPDRHVEEGRPHFYGYRLGPGSPSGLAEEVQRLTAELALKDQALAEIKHALESGTWPGYGLTVERIERVLTRLDTQGETK